MKIEFDKKKGAEALAGLKQGAAEIGKNAVELSKKAADGAKNGLSVAVEKAKNDNQERRLKKLNPLFPEQYNSAAFNLPNMIVIVDDAVRKDEALCEGAIGWLGKEKDMEVLYLYDEAVPTCGLRFVPSANCDAAYYVDNFDRCRFVRVDCIFDKALEEKLAELDHIAFCLGAKRCTVKISESEKEERSKKRIFDLNARRTEGDASAKAEEGFFERSYTTRKGLLDSCYEGNAIPQMPTLKWFEHDNMVRALIDARCNGTHGIKTKTLNLSTASHATMARETARSIDAAVNGIANVKGRSSLSAKAEKEHSFSMEFYVEF